MTAGEAFAALIEDHQVTAGFAMDALNIAEAKAPAFHVVQAPRSLIGITYHSPENVSLDVVSN